MSKRYSRKTILELFPEAMEKLTDCVRRADEMAFKRLIGLYAADASAEEKAVWIKEFRKLVEAYRATYPR
jgi:hypothetical protein